MNIELQDSKGFVEDYMGESIKDFVIAISQRTESDPSGVSNFRIKDGNKYIHLYLSEKRLNDSLEGNITQPFPGIYHKQAKIYLSCEDYSLKVERQQQKPRTFWQELFEGPEQTITLPYMLELPQSLTMDALTDLDNNSYGTRMDFLLVNLGYNVPLYLALESIS